MQKLNICANFSSNIQKVESRYEKDLYPSLQKSLKQISAKQGYKSYKIFKRLILTKGGNYFGDLYEVDIKGKGKNGIKETNLFVKHARKMELANYLINVNSIYQNEIFVYRELSRILKNLQDKACIPFNERYEMVKVFDESNKEAIILDNLSKKGYETRYRMDVMMFSFAEFSIKQIAKFHGLSFVLEQKKSNYYERNIKTIRTPLKFNDPMRYLIKKQSDSILQYFDSNIKNKLKNFIPKIMEKLPKYLGGETGSVKCLCHGDFRINNILIKECDSESPETILIDYQIIFFGSPVYDLLYFLYTGTDRQFRKNHMENLKDIYHESLRDYLKFFNINVDEVYPRKHFQDDFEEHLDLGLMLAFYVLPFCFTLEDEIPDFSKDTVEDMNFKFDDRFIQRFKGIVEDYLEWGII